MEPQFSQLYELARPESPVFVGVCNGSVRGTAWTRDNAFVLAASTDNVVRIWAAESGSNIPVATLTDHRDYASGVAVSADNERLGTTSDDRTLQVCGVHEWFPC
eukprot:TRINITY_DN2080_c0_g1_i7.p2 TRINITY_DN2080_c0_g1~~TRINITY_DN2080_c0_g1_i7.p2  ORF type:complete len:104 (-),score=19.66 TRINITY_DN2080_c0_g1_i7:36-347(-)